MAILTFPTITPDTQTFGIQYNTQVSSTALSGIVQTVELPGARWKGNMSFRDMTTTESADFKAFLLELRGASGRFFFGDLELTAPQDSTLSGTFTIQGGSTSRVITTNSPSAGTFTVGDRIQIGTDDDREYKMIIGVSGNDLTVEPMIRRNSFIGQSVIYNAPKGVFLLDSDDQAMWGIRSKAKLSDINISFIEAFT